MQELNRKPWVQQARTCPKEPLLNQGFIQQLKQPPVHENPFKNLVGNHPTYLTSDARRFAIEITLYLSEQSFVHQNRFPLLNDNCRHDISPFFRQTWLANWKNAYPKLKRKKTKYKNIKFQNYPLSLSKISQIFSKYWMNKIIYEWTML